MFIRCSRTRNQLIGESYFTYRLVRSERIGNKVRQITLLNLGRHFSLAPAQWPSLCLRIEQLMSAQGYLMPAQLPAQIESLAQRYAAQLVARSVGEQGPASSQTSASFQEIDVNSIQDVRPRSVGVEHVGLKAIEQLGLADKLNECGVNRKLCNVAIANVIGRMAQPGSELFTWRWLTTTSALGELLDVDFEAMSLMQLYRASDMLIKHREAIETHLFERVRGLFGLDATVTLYDLTNTYFEGTCHRNPKAVRGRSKEKRSDCPLVTLGLVLDSSGFVRRSRMFAGNIAEAKTLKDMLEALAAPPGALVVMDAGIATEANIAWLIAQGYRYLVVRRGGTRQFDPDQAVEIKSASDQTIKIQKVLSEDGKEVQLYCHSLERQKKEAGIAQRLCMRFEAGLKALADGLTKPRGQKRVDKLRERIGRLKAKSRVGRHYDIILTADETGQKATALTWTRLPVEGTMLTHPGVYCLRTNETAWDEPQLWQTYTMLTDLEAVFRSLKSELGLRPIYHHKEERSDGHLFISVLAYQLVQTLRQQLKAKDIHYSWSTLREILSVQRRTTSTFRQRDGRTLHVRKSSVPEPALKAIYDALALHPLPGGTKKLIA